MDEEYFNYFGIDVINCQEELKRKCRECKRECNHTSEEKMECLANLMTIEYLLDNS